MKIGKRIKELRVSKNMTQLELANILCVSDRTVSKWEQERGNPDIDMLPMIAETFNVTIDFLITGVDGNSFQKHEHQSLSEFVSNKIAPKALDEDGVLVLDGLEKEYDYELIRNCFIIALGQVVSKNVSEDEFVKTLLLQIKRVAFIKSRPLVEQKVNELYYTYRKKELGSYFEKTKFIKSIYYYLSKADLKTDEEKVSYLENVLLPIINNSKDNEEIKANFKELKKNKSPFADDNELKKEPDIDMLDEKIRIMETRSPKEFLSLLQGGTKPAKSDLKVVEMLEKDFAFKNGVINTIIDYCLAMDNHILNRAYVEKVAASVARAGTQNVRETIDYFRSVNKKKKFFQHDPVEKKPKKRKRKPRRTLKIDD